MRISSDFLQLTPLDHCSLPFLWPCSDACVKHDKEMQMFQLYVTLGKGVVLIFKVCKNPADIVPR